MVKILNMTFPGIKKTAVSIVLVCLSAVCSAQLQPPRQTDTLQIISIRYNSMDILRENWPCELIYMSTTDFDICGQKFKIAYVLDSTKEYTYVLIDSTKTDRVCYLKYSENSRGRYESKESEKIIDIEFSGYEFKCKEYTITDSSVQADDTIIPDEKKLDDTIPFQMVDEKPSFWGGDANSFSKWVNQRLVYPEKEKKKGAQGMVTLQFTIDIDGSVTDVKVLNSVSPGLDAEAVRVVSSSPKWTPRKLDGRVVRVTYTFPVIFQLR